VLKHKEDYTGKNVEKLLNDYDVKKNLQTMIDETSRHVSKLRAKYNKTTTDGYNAFKLQDLCMRSGAGSPENTIRFNRSIDFNDRASISAYNQ
jgi:predicted metal-dependent hydrolase